MAEDTLEAITINAPPRHKDQAAKYSINEQTPISGGGCPAISVPDRRKSGNIANRQRNYENCGDIVHIPSASSRDERSGEQTERYTPIQHLCSAK